MGYVGSRMRRLEDPQAASAVGHFADDEKRSGQLCRSGLPINPERVCQLITASSRVSALPADCSSWMNIQPFGQMVRQSR